jgi:hypothetical protein
MTVAIEGWYAIEKTMQVIIGECWDRGIAIELLLDYKMVWSLAIELFLTKVDA